MLHSPLKNNVMTTIFHLDVSAGGTQEDGQAVLYNISLVPNKV